MAIARVLIVDDDPNVLKATCMYLRGCESYEVLSAASPYRALEIIKGTTPVDLVISDVEMPEMKGPELLRKITQISPETATMLMSGYVAEPEKLPLGVALLEKPFSSTELLSKVEEVLAESKRIHEALARTMEKNAELSRNMLNLRNELSETINTAKTSFQQARKTINGEKQDQEQSSSKDKPIKDA
jgi:response regulator RpfG family c-di-GMP phosphodiesterase